MEQPDIHMYLDTLPQLDMYTFILQLIILTEEAQLSLQEEDLKQDQLLGSQYFAVFFALLYAA
jgi:hypothetical protein